MDRNEEVIEGIRQETVERFHEKRKEIQTDHIPPMGNDSFLNSLLDTLDAVERGYYNDE